MMQPLEPKTLAVSKNWLVLRCQLFSVTKRRRIKKGQCIQYFPVTSNSQHLLSHDSFFSLTHSVLLRAHLHTCNVSNVYPKEIQLHGKGWSCIISKVFLPKCHSVYCNIVEKQPFRITMET